MADEPTLALADLDTIKAVQEQHSIESGVRKRHTHTMDGRPLPADCEIWTLHGQEIVPVLGPDGKTTLYTHPLPAKALKAEVAAKVTAITAAQGEQMKAAKEAKDKAEAEAVEDAEPVEDLKP